MLPPRPFAVTFHEVLDKWDEGTVTWANQPRFADRPVATAVINAKEDTVRLDATKLARHGARHGWLVKVAEPLADGVTAPAEGGNKVAAVAFTEADYGDWRPADMVVLLERMLVAKPQGGGQEKKYPGPSRPVLSERRGVSPPVGTSNLVGNAVG